MDDLILLDRWMVTWEVVMRHCIIYRESAEEIWACAERIMGYSNDS